MANAGASFIVQGQRVEVGPVKFGSYAKRIGLEPGFEVKTLLLPAERPSPYWIFVPSLAVLGLIAWLQRRRLSN